ncbi:exopolyphosphatase / guanosine-5'-triphosphate,3'-diphosphate pyrophosphatase [Chitinophaga costaii]|uniref:Exopolyphosphatase / guanosine-5'-triphosphate,3'-diphosphate pyrophosphatase n=1 Tax=Chitinophaga costaii TaxID=1335309 RepID=A0A1C4FK58_9BACT|nr:exopolyphosphatase [Chitinophaga costaii]PUZ20318.1 exopolyphosphatase [Chitinophaga costaii]SCC55881.1 exopolyphosphatase / guanosine-5'-triphosphate,3'-diphosphate pyrophosphatase [Chitinophaga costaii]
MKLAAIDIGSNAGRLLISEASPNSLGEMDFTKINLVRVPLRLGFDVFDTKRISDKKAEELVKTIQAYKLLLEVYEVKHLKACATSAMRDAENGQEILARVKAETGIDIHIITGQEEASFIYENHIAEHLDITKSYLYIDVGGGSTEITCFSANRLLFKESFNIGTIRLLHNQVTEEQWQQLKSFIKNQLRQLLNVVAIGSGGNINKIFSLSKRKEGKPLSLETLKNYHKELSSVSQDERIHVYKLREDRADVIVPALLIYINIMRWANAEEIFVPKIGLADGIIHALYNEVTHQPSFDMEKA